MTFAPEILVAPQTTRYQIISVLGRGATSFVYRAFDSEKNFVVALKSVRFPEHDEIFRIKQEFRFFRDFYHENLVNLYDLYVENNVSFYTMELIEGVDFVSFVRNHPASLRTCLGQLVNGLAALHDAGRLHRDLKPSNILVEPDGRTILLDFGLSIETRSTDSIVTETRLYAGTLGYMAPEQFVGEPASEASDLYALGVILYQALTGSRPYPNLPPVALYEAQKSPPLPPHDTNPDVPADLAHMAVALLSFNPRDRPPLSELQLLALAGIERAAGQARFRLSDRGSPPLVGRDAELERLKAALARSLAGCPVAVHVSGMSGVGKTTLIERFLADAHREFGALAMRSRCHHQESVRLNAVDGLIDMLSRYLMAETEGRLSQLAPTNLPALVTMFPMLSRVPFQFKGTHEGTVPKDLQSLVRQALAALRDLLQRIAATRPLILWVDDLQWSDASSLPVLRHIAGSGEGKPILSIFSYRSEDLQPDSVAAVLGRDPAHDLGVEVERLLLQPLDESAVGTLIQCLWDEASRPDPGWVREVVQQSAGLPFFVLEFAAFRQRWPVADHADADGMSAAAVLKHRIAALPQPQRVVLEIVSVAGSPIAEETLLRITAREAASGREVYLLLNQRLLRKTAAATRPAVETYHDRIRMAVLESLAPATRRLRHREIADEMVGAEEIDHAMLVEHFLGAGEPEIAAEHAILEGRRARERLTFNQAAEFFLLASRLHDPFAHDGALAIELANALADAGRSAESGDLFLRTARAIQADRPAAAVCEARAAQQLLYSGRFSEGQAVYRKLFVDLGIAFPETVRAARRLSLTNRLALAVGLWTVRLRPVHENAADRLLRVDALWAASKGFMMLDFVVGDAIFSCYMREAAKLGEPSRIMRAMAVESSVLANVGRRWSIRRSESLMRRAQVLGHGSTDPYDRVVLRTCQSGVAWFRGQWQESADLAHEAIALHRRDCVRYDFEVSISQAYRVSALVMQGALTQAKAEALEAINDAQRRGDTYVSRLFRTGYLVYVSLAEDDAETAITDAATLLYDVPPNRFTSMHWSHFIGMVNALVYTGAAWEAWSLVQRQWPSLQETGFLRLGCIGAHLREIRTRAALKAAATGPPPEPCKGWTRERLLRVAEGDALKIAQTGALSHAHATAAAIRSGIAALRGRPDRVLLAAVCEGFGKSGMAVHRAAAELQLAALGDGELAAGARRTLEREGVLRPDRMSAFLMFA